MNVIASTEVDPYKVFNIGDSFTLDQLQQRFLELSKKYDPALNAAAGDTETVMVYENMFNVVKKCYVTLKNKHFGPTMNAGDQQQQQQKQKFDLEKFNEVFVNTKLADVYETTGYGDWNAPVKERAIVNKHDPKPLTGGGSEFYELGLEKISDFSGATESSLEFMDYKLAHSTTKLVDERFVKAPTYKSLKEIEAQRSSISFTMSPEEQSRMERQKVKEAKLDEKRMKSMKKFNDMAAHLHNDAKVQMGVQ